ncbi:hypothetical protein NAPIS_ORF00547 [Vairimorpha apis BRL 01]|uniref:Uncharacterized protein n=1 Tax=Vairimorpha apis BRL 01 TaxID=1037528 RepID=T0L2U7_9MICR|nr:hypothetical protein NAPIS_ORF00547 [Vairimorpha apis BRL 01]
MYKNSKISCQNILNIKLYKVYLGLIHGCKTRIIPYVLTWDGLVTKYHTKYRKALEISDRIEAYIQSVTLKKTLESVSLEYRRGGDLILVESERNENVHLIETFDAEAKNNK